jgi:signal transduction histidine kinase
VSTYTPATMDTGGDGERERARFDALYEEAKQALSYTANQLRDLAERARQIHGEAATEWQQASPAGPEPPSSSSAARSEELVRQRQEVERLDLAVKSLESSWLLLERGAHDHLEEDEPEGLSVDERMRVLEAHEAERSRLAQEIHDGPAQTLVNAVFLVELVDRQMESDPLAARRELRSLRELVDRELVEIRGFINQLRPDIDSLGLDEALREAAEQPSQPDLAMTVDLKAPADLLGPEQQAVVLRIAQEALRNVRKHAQARQATLSTRLEPSPEADGASEWLLEVQDDGQGFDAEHIGRPGRRSFGLRFMRQRAELVGAQLDIRSSATTGTTVRLTINGAHRR